MDAAKEAIDYLRQALGDTARKAGAGQCTIQFGFDDCSIEIIWREPEEE